MKFTGLLLFVALGAMPLTMRAQFPIKDQDSLARVLVNRHIAINQAKRTMPGYRIQIYFGPNRTKATEVKTDFLKMFPKVGSYLVYQQPNFKIRVGDFKTRLEAMKFWKEIQPLYSSSFIVKDDVKIPE